MSERFNWQSRVVVIVPFLLGLGLGWLVWRAPQAQIVGAKAIPEGAQPVPCTPLAVGVIEPQKPYPAPGEVQKTMQAQAVTGSLPVVTTLPVQALVATPSPEPTYDWLQPGRDIPCDMLKAISEASMNYRCEALWASELREPHVQRALRIEPGAQLTRVHQFGRYWWILFEEEIIVWLDNGDPRILVGSPVNGCWKALPESLKPPTTPTR